MNKALANKLNLLERLDYVHNLSSQLEWQQNPGDRTFRVMYTTAGQPTAAQMGPSDLVAERLYWVKCCSQSEVNYLLAIINSDALLKAAEPFMSKGLFGARDLHKHLWKLPIPAFDPALELHTAIAEAGATAAQEAKERLTALRARLDREGKELTVAIARKELREWLRASPEGKAVEDAVGKLLTGG